MMEPSRCPDVGDEWSRPFRGDVPVLGLPEVGDLVVVSECPCETFEKDELEGDPIPVAEREIALSDGGKWEVVFLEFVENGVVEWAMASS